MNIFKIFKTDFKKIIKNPVAIGMIIGLCIIPSFYAWITLKANWNPYVNTGNVPVAVVNNDLGTIVNNKIVNFGNDTVQELEHNNTIKWTFVGQKVADQGLKDGSYYAVIEIPSNFSAQLEAGIAGSGVKPELIYKVNEKTNAIATKITDIASQQLQEGVKSTFLYAASNAVLEQANKMGQKIDLNKPLILEAKNVIANTNTSVGNILSSVNNSSTSIGELGGSIKDLQNNLPQLTKQIDNLQSVVSSSKFLIQATQSNMKNIGNSLNNTTNNINNTNNSLQTFVKNLSDTVATQEKVNQNAVDAANTAVNAASSTVVNTTNTAKNVVQTTGEKINNTVNQVNGAAAKGLNTAKTVNDNVGKALTTTKKNVDSAANKVNNAIDNSNKDLSTSETSKQNNEASEVAKNGQDQNVINNKTQIKIPPKIAHFTKEQIEEDQNILNNAITTNKNISSLINSGIQFLDTLNKINGNNILSGLINDLNTLQQSVQEQNAAFNNLNQTLSSSNEVTANMINSELNNISDLSTSINSLLGDFSKSYNNTVDSSLNSITNNLNNSLDTVNTVLATSKEMIPQINEIAKVGIASSDLTVNQIDSLKSKLDGLKTNLNNLENQTKNLNTTSIDNIINLLNKNPQQLALMLASPIGIQVQELYGMSIFGIGLAPFYTVLAIWVGVLLATTIISVGGKAYENGTRKRIMEIHFARMLLFFIISLIQTSIVTLGDVFLLGIKPANFWLLLGFAWLTSLVFTVIEFTLVSLSGNFGKAGSLVLMVIQVAGSGAIYPIEVNPIFLQKLEFLWPFTYAIDGFRQAIGGPDWSQVSMDVIALLIFLVIFVVIGFSKMFISKQIDYVENAFKESEL
ncbi:MAG: YhgE/Pip family protein [Sarcina sp.]